MQTSQLYEQYKNDFIQNCRKLQVMTPKNDFKDYKKLIEDNNLLLRQIAIEMCSLGKLKAGQQGKVVTLCQQQLKSYKDNFILYKKRMQQTELFYQSLGQKDLDQSQVRLQNQTIYEQNQKLSQTKKLLYQIEQTSQSIGQNLGKQSQGLIGMKSKVQGIGSVLNKANQLVDIMLKRQNRRKRVVLVVLLVVFAIIMALKFCCY